jgi:peptidoglycan DL-endopeptidase CwlO
MTSTHRAGPGHALQPIRRANPGVRLLGFVSLALVGLTAGVVLPAGSASAGEIDLNEADSGEIRSHLEELRQRRTSEEEKRDLLEAERLELNAVFAEGERDFGTPRAQLEQATEALNAADGGLSGTVEALGAFRIEQARSHDAVERASERLASVGPEIARSAEAIERLTGDIDRAERALEEAERAAAQAQARNRSRETASVGPPASGNAIVQFAYEQVGKSYGYGRSGPDSYDCSGLVVAAYAQSGVSLSRTSQGQWSDTVAIDRGDLSPGDLVFSYGTGHVAIYVGGGQVVHATKPGDTVKVASMDVMPVTGYRRVGG